MRLVEPWAPGAEFPAFSKTPLACCLLLHWHAGDGMAGLVVTIGGVPSQEGKHHMQYLLKILAEEEILVAELVTPDGMTDFAQSIPLSQSMNGVYVRRLDCKVGQSPR